MALALKTGSAQAAQLGFLMFFPLLFLSPAFAPKESSRRGWSSSRRSTRSRTSSKGMRVLVLDGWDAAALAKAFAAIFGMGAFTMSLVLLGPPQPHGVRPEALVARPALLP